MKSEIEIFVWMKKSYTDPELVKVIKRAIRGLRQEGDDRLEAVEGDSEEVTQLIESQNEIGWLHFMKGRLSRKFRDKQDRYFEMINDKRSTKGEELLHVKFSGIWWAKGLIKRLIYHSLLLWQIRNNFVHEEDYEEDRRIKKDSMNKQIIEIYERRETGNERTKYLFNISLVKRCMKSVKSREAWLRHVKLEYNNGSSSTSDSVSPG